MYDNNTTRILSMGAARRREWRREQARAELAELEQRALAKLVQECWIIQHDEQGNWAATMNGDHQ